MLASIFYTIASFLAKAACVIFVIAFYVSLYKAIKN